MLNLNLAIEVFLQLQISCMVKTKLVFFLCVLSRIFHCRTINRSISRDNFTQKCFTHIRILTISVTYITNVISPQLTGEVNLLKFIY